MNKWLVAVISIGITVNANAEVFSMMDQFFEDFEVVDDDYHYVDLDTASIFFDSMDRVANEKINNEQPEFNLGDKNYLMSWKMNLYSSSIAVKNMEPSLQELGVNELCQSFYSAKYQAANNVVVKLSSYDNQDNLVETVILNKEVCS